MIPFCFRGQTPPIPSTKGECEVPIDAIDGSSVIAGRCVGPCKCSAAALDFADQIGFRRWQQAIPIGIPATAWDLPRRTVADLGAAVGVDVDKPPESAHRDLEAVEVKRIDIGRSSGVIAPIVGSRVDEDGRAARFHAVRAASIKQSATTLGDAETTKTHVGTTVGIVLAGFVLG